jgi:clorobiocin biosynthesis protein CloN6
MLDDAIALPILKADLILLHAPSVFDFRQRDDVLFAYLSDSDSVNVTSVFEIYPLGFLALQQYLQKHGLQVLIVNLASLMLQHPDLVVDRLLAYLEARFLVWIYIGWRTAMAQLKSLDGSRLCTREAW